jgi:hypothetical protein
MHSQHIRAVAYVRAGAAILVRGQPVVTLTVYDTHDASTTSGFDNLFDNGAIIYPTLSVPTAFFRHAGTPEPLGGV